MRARLLSLSPMHFPHLKAPQIQHVQPSKMHLNFQLSVCQKEFWNVWLDNPSWDSDKHGYFDVSAVRILLFPNRICWPLGLSTCPVKLLLSLEKV